MVSRRVITVLVAGFASLLVAFSLLIAASILAAGLGDELGATVLRWVACGGGILATIDFVLLVIALGLNAVEPPPRRDDSQGGPS